MPNLFIFGDSWATSQDCIDTWPELVAHRRKWTVFNMAEPHSGSDALASQLHDLHRMLALRPHSGVRADDIAIVHTGGNDLFFSGLRSLSAVAMSGACLCGLYSPHVARQISDNVAALVQALLQLGVRRVALVGVPLTTAMPFIANNAAGVPGALAVASCIMRGSNRLLLRALDEALTSAQERAGVSLHLALTLDEAHAVDRVVHEAGGGTSADADDWWIDISHPSQKLHAALAELLLVPLQRGLDAAAKLPPPPSHDGDDDAASKEDDVRARLLPEATPPEREAM